LSRVVDGEEITSVVRHRGICWEDGTPCLGHGHIAFVGVLVHGQIRGASALNFVVLDAGCGRSERGFLRVKLRLLAAT